MNAHPPKAVRRRRWLQAAIGVTVGWSGLWGGLSSATAQPADERGRIEWLLQAMERQPGVTFERNGRRVSGRDAVRFLRAKWQHQGQGVDSAEAFIEHIASRSSTSGRPYRVCEADGACVDAGPWLRRLLAQSPVRGS